jgi:hypothetical protein
MLKAIVNGKKVQIETSWEELSFEKYLKLIEAKDDNAELLSILLDVPAETIRKGKITGLEKVLKGISFMRQSALIDENPTKLGEWILPKDITFESVGQYETMRTKINESIKMDDLKKQNEMLAHYAAIYCQPLNGEEFDSEKAEWLVPAIMKLPCLEVMSAGNFFQAKCLSIQSGLPMNYLRKNIPMKRNRPVLNALARRSGFTRLWTILRAMWEKVTRR